MAKKKDKEKVEPKVDEEPKKEESKGKSYITDDPVIAEVVQRATNVIPLVTGNSMHRTRKYEFKGVSSADAQKAIDVADKDDKGKIILS